MNSFACGSRAVRGAVLAAVMGAAAFAPLAASAGEPVDFSAGTIAEAPWSRWQGRVGLGGPLGDGLFGAGPGVVGFLGDSAGAGSGLSLVGDYYFTQHGLAERNSFSGGFRATGGLFVGPRSGLWLATPTSLSALGGGIVTQRRSFGLLSPTGPEASDNSSVPYVGVGYTGLKSLRATGGGWGFSADVGVMALQPRSAVRFGQQGLNDGARDTQLSPMLQLGVSYSF